jgi:GDPmannose 4,6-dehydratase
VQYSVREFVDIAAAELGLTLEWAGSGESEEGVVATFDDKGLGLRAAQLVGKTIVKVDPKYFRPTEVETLLGDSTKARNKLGWTPSISFEQMVSEMVSYDLDQAKRFTTLSDSGFNLALTKE